MSIPAGVPALPVNINFSTPAIVLADVSAILGLFAAPQWGIFDQSGQPVIVGDSVLSFENTRDSNISKYPVEQGSFASYNKVQTPFGVKFTFTKGGSISARTAFLNSLDTAQNSLALYIGHVPERPYNNISIDHYDLRRDAKHGVTLLTVDVWCEEIRQAPPLQFSNNGIPNLTSVISPDAASAINLGTVQAITPPAQISEDGMVGPIPGSATTTPPTVSAGGINLTSAIGNTQPPSSASPISSSVVWDNAMGTGAGTISSFTTSPITGATTGYGLTSGASIPVNQCTMFNPQGFTIVQ